MAVHLRHRAALRARRRARWSTNAATRSWSTDAAIAYLTDLYGEFDDWHLALAAYNSGAGNVRRAIRRSGSRDFWEPSAITCRGRPQLRAGLHRVGRSSPSSRSGSDSPRRVESPTGSTTTSGFADALDLQFLAGKIDLEVADLRELNPAIRRDLTPAAGRDRPSGCRWATGDGRSVLAATPTTEWAPRMMHSVRSGESLYSIAQRTVRACRPSARPTASAAA